MIQDYIGIVGLFFIIGLAYALSSNRKAIRSKTVMWGIGLQVFLALFMMKLPYGVKIINLAAQATVALMDKANTGAAFVFGELASSNQLGFIFIFKAVPIIIFLSSLFAVLYYVGFLQLVVKLMAKIMMRTMGTSGAESVAATANVFMGQSEAPLVIAPFIEKMTKSEIAALMIGGMATISGAVLGVYIEFGAKAEFLLAASIMNAPAALLIAKLMFPEVEKPETEGNVDFQIEKTEINIIDAAAKGASAGMVLSLNVAAMLIAFVSLTALLNWPLHALGSSLEQIFAFFFAPLAFLMGVPWSECNIVGTLFGQKIIINEFIAYQSLGELKVSGAISAHSELIATYALCGFANIGSIAIQIGGIGALAPNRKRDLAQLGVRALIGGSLATFMTATIAGLLN